MAEEYSDRKFLKMLTCELVYSNISLEAEQNGMTLISWSLWHGDNNGTVVGGAGDLRKGCRKEKEDFSENLLYLHKFFKV